MFSSSLDEHIFARSIVAAFDENPGKAAVGINRKMYEQPHLQAAKRILRSVVSRFSD